MRRREYSSLCTAAILHIPIQLYLRCLQRVSPPEPRKPRIVPVGCDPLAPGLYGQRGKIRVLCQIAPGIGTARDFLKDLPVPDPGLNSDRVGLAPKSGCECECFFECARLFVDPVMRCDTHDSGQDMVRHSHRLITGEAFEKPSAVFLMFVGVLAKGVQEDVDVAENQPGSSIKL